MREIKFRAWDGILMFDVGVKDGQALVWDEPTDGWIPVYDDSWPIMQYTSLKDKNGKEIYEGDITKWHYGGHWAVEWNDGESHIGDPDDKWGDTIGFCIVSHEIGNNGYYLMEPLASDRIYEIIGNIYENPELIK